MKDKTTLDKEKIERIYKKIGENVKALRQEKKISQLTLALAIGHKAVGTVSMAEIYHKKKHFNIEHLVKIADVLEVELARLFEGVDDIIKEDVFKNDQEVI